MSQTAINNWIDENRFVGFRRERGKHARIPHVTPFRPRDGRVEPLGLVVERYKQQPVVSFANDDERDMILADIEAMKQKYGGKRFEEAFDFEAMTPEQESDASRWRFFQMRLNDLT